ncbi:hypothetical protein KQI52_03270 [bacterium]|nr:hypothetical protein [bacterium]
MSPRHVSILILCLVLSGFAVSGCDEDDAVIPPEPPANFAAEDFFPLWRGVDHHFANHVDGELISTETWYVIRSEQDQDRRTCEVLIMLYDLDQVVLGRDTVRYAFEADSVFVYNDEADEWEKDPFLSGWGAVDPPATHEFTRVNEEQGGLTVDYVAGYLGDGFDYTIESFTYPQCRKITEDATVVGQDHTVSGVRYYAMEVGLVYSDLTDTYQVGETEITIHREKLRVE